MAISAVNNTTAFSAYTDYARNDANLKNSMELLSTGRKGVSEDAAGVSISERMRSMIGGTDMSRQNIENGVSVMQTADGWLQKTNDMLTRMRELSIQAIDDTKASADRANLQTEFEQLQTEMASIINTASFNGKKLLDGGLSSAVLQIGANSGETMTISIDDMNSVLSAVIAASTAVASIGAASSATSTIESAVDAVSSERATIGGQISRMESRISGLLSYENNIRAAESKVRDVDMAQESANMAQQRAMSQVSNAMLTQANSLPNQVIQLVQ